MGVVCALGLVGCGESSDAPQGDEAIGELSKPLSSFTLQTGQTIEFFDLGGYVAVTESANLGISSILVERGLVSAPADEIYKQLQPGKPLPSALVEALARVVERPKGEVGAPSEAQLAAQGAAPTPASQEFHSDGGENIGQSQEAYVTHTAFINGGGCDFSFAMPAQFTDCRRWTGNGYWANWWSKNAFYQAASGAGGAFTMRATLASFTPLLTIVNAGQWKGSGWQGNGAPGTQLNQIEITGASGDTFSVSAMFYNNP